MLVAGKDIESAVQRLAQANGTRSGHPLHYGNPAALSRGDHGHH